MFALSGGDVGSFLVWAIFDGYLGEGTNLGFNPGFEPDEGREFTDSIWLPHIRRVRSHSG
ncbi:hypothetical protein HanIR_Chr10g0463121 [Helianthus annuus]|nr:hypothetical protein HanIR_Chr10g0463121 [Helianthus annuus]